MGIQSDGFKSIGGDRNLTADRMANRFRRVYTDGIFGEDAILTTELKCTKGTGDLEIDIALGDGMVNGYFVTVYDTSETIEIDAGDAVNPRIDRIILRLDLDDTDSADPDKRAITIQVLKGTPASSPTAPTLTYTGNVYELSLCQVAVAAAATSITSGNITDERAISSVKASAGLTDKEVWIINQLYGG